MTKQDEVISLATFIDLEVQSVKNFLVYWVYQQFNKGDEDFPGQMAYEDWIDQYFAYYNLRMEREDEAAAHEQGG